MHARSKLQKEGGNCKSFPDRKLIGNDLHEKKMGKREEEEEELELEH